MRRKVNNSEIHETKRYYEVPSEKVQEWSDTIENLTKQCYQYKEENEQLKEENEKLKTQKIAFQRSYKQAYEENKDLKDKIERL